MEVEMETYINWSAVGCFKIHQVDGTSSLPKRRVALSRPNDTGEVNEKLLVRLSVCVNAITPFFDATVHIVQYFEIITKL